MQCRWLWLGQPVPLFYSSSQSDSDELDARIDTSGAVTVTHARRFVSAGIFAFED
jgi:hypothetical protein